MTFARSGPSALELEAVGQARLEEVEAEALANLRGELAWQPFTFGNDADGEDAIDITGFLECSEHTVAASGVLDPDFLREAQRQLGYARIVVAFPCQAPLLAASADLPPTRPAGRPPWRGSSPAGTCRARTSSAT